MYKEKIQRICKQCGKAFAVSKSATTAREGHKQTGVFCSKKCADNNKRTLTGNKRYNYKGGPYPLACEVCGTIKMVRHSLAQRFRVCSRRCGAELARRSAVRSSSLERLMLEAFINEGIQVMPQYPLRWYTVDFAIPSCHLVIECDGEYWHSLPKQAARDKRKDAYLKKHGWTVIRLAETDIRTSPRACVQRVCSHLPQHFNLSLEL
jgi:very-short-patch-repair endonuclease